MRMNNKELMTLISIYKDMAKQHKSGLALRIKLYFTKKKIDKIIKKIAQVQADLVFNQTVKLYEDIVSSNIK